MSDARIRHDTSIFYILSRIRCVLVCRVHRARVNGLCSCNIVFGISKDGGQYLLTMMIILGKYIFSNIKVIYLLPLNNGRLISLGPCGEDNKDPEKA